MFRIRTALLLALLCAAAPATASPWAETGDNQLRGDVEILAAAGVIDGVTTQWPLPWNAIVKALKGNALAGYPASVQAAARRVLAHARGENQQGLSLSATLDAATRPAVVYGFDGMGRGDGQAQITLDYSGQDFAARLAVGAFTQDFRGSSTKLMLDESYVATKLGPLLLYGGELSHWWSPGWISSLALSNNARPIPQIGIQRLDTSASSWPVLRWLGPWQAEFLVGWLDGPRIAKNTLYDALRVTINPAPGLEIGLARTQELCGEGHPCSPVSSYFDLSNDPNHIDKTNDQGLFDIKYSHSIGGVPTQVYLQLMNEDSSPFTHSGTSHLFGVTAFLPAPGNPLRLTVEYTDSVPTLDIFSFGDVLHGFSYNNGDYPDGMRYRGRSLGFSLDSDSRLLSLQAGWTDAGGRFYELTLHHAVISNPNIDIDNPNYFNVVSSAPVIANIGEARISLPFAGMKLDLAGRLQDDQPRPKSGFAAGFEAALRVRL